MRLLSLVPSLSLVGLLVLAGCSAPAAAPTAVPQAPTAAPAAKPTAAAPAAAPTAAPAAKPTQAAPAPTTAPASTSAKPTTAPASASNLTGTLKIDTVSEIESPHPFFASQIVGISVRMNVFDSLVDREWDGKIVPALAESWNVVDDTTIDFKIRKGVKFHNGAEMTVEDVKSSMDHLLDKEIKSPTTSIFASFKEMQVLDPQNGSTGACEN